MANINLSRAGQHDAETAPSFFDMTTSVSIGLIVVVVVVYFGLFFYNNSLQDRSAQTTQDMQDLQKKLATSDVQGVIDFSRRSDEIRQYLASASIPTDTLDKLEGATMGEVVLTSYNRTADGAVTLEGRTSSIKIVAQQLVAYKTKFSNVSTSKVAFDQAGNVIFNVTMTDKSSS